MECRESSFGQMGGGCAVSTIVCDIGTWQVHDVGQGWQRLGGVHMEKSVCTVRGTPTETSEHLRNYVKSCEIM